MYTDRCRVPLVKLYLVSVVQLPSAHNEPKQMSRYYAEAGFHYFTKVVRHTVDQKLPVLQLLP